ncbi:hypothetical protein HQ34_06385 [Porphyromonas cangingivalis]|nr:hypothetical protein HQ34_06385 [Porphyromonas cangingivalis]
MHIEKLLVRATVSQRYYIYFRYKSTLFGRIVRGFEGFYLRNVSFSIRMVKVLWKLEFERFFMPEIFEPGEK